MGGKGGALTTIGGAAQPGGWKQALGYYSFNVPDGCGCFNPNALTVHMLTDILREYWKDMCENRVYVEWGYLDCVVGGCSGNTIKWQVFLVWATPFSE